MPIALSRASAQSSVRLGGSQHLRSHGLNSGYPALTTLHEIAKLFFLWKPAFRAQNDFPASLSHTFKGRMITVGQ